MFEAVLLQMGRAAMASGKPNDAVVALRQLIQLDPRNKDGRHTLALAYIMTGDPANARDVLDGLLKEERSARAYYARALAHYGLKRKEEATADIESAIRIGGDNPSLREWQAKIKAMK
jgi:tetratricopeptide (TPR) repeat protein